MQRCSSWASFGSSNPNMSRIPIKPSVACRTALFNAAIDFEPEFPPTVDACWLFTSTWLWTDSLESELRVPLPSLIRNVGIKNQNMFCARFLPFQTVSSTYNSRNSSAVQSLCQGVSSHVGHACIAVWFYQLTVTASSVMSSRCQPSAMV